MNRLWLAAFFWLTRRVPRLMDAIGGPICAGVFACSALVRESTRANARHLLGARSTDTERDRLARRIIRSFYRFCCDVGQSVGLPREGLLARVAVVEGHERYLASRQAGKGVIIVTAHMGSFEIGLAALRKYEPKIHVIFRPDLLASFERQRSALRQSLGVIEHPVDEGWTLWLSLRDALRNNEAVVMQGDRVMPGQKGRVGPFLDGMMELPLGPVKLAVAADAPLLPIFAIRQPDGRVRLIVEEPIVISAPGGPIGMDEAHQRLRQVLERYARQYPEQWLMLQPAWTESAGEPGSAT